MTRRATRLIAALSLIFGLAALAACKKKTPVNPDPVEVSETFTGTISPLGSSSHTFSVNYIYAFSDATFNVTSLTTVADSSAKAITIGVGYGSINVGVCTRIAQFSNPAAPLNQEVPTTGGTFGPGTYCIQVFDNPDSPTVTEALRYSITVKHY